ncbi:hypothetical protein Pfo_027180 [Paulownia fortunei]|nr:hypothetical protein Pfo_027180 [Paulownia fortunei]
MTYIMMKVLSLLFFVVFNIFQATAHKCFLTHKIEVHVINNLPSNSAPLTLHCASGDNDLGHHTLAVNQDFNWSFCENIYYPNTLFFCHLWWGSKQRAFEVFNSKWVQPDSTQHYWLAKSDGIYFSYSNSPQTFTKRYDWN